MTQIAGFLIVFVLVIAGLWATGASAALSALPFELSLICGAALGTLLIGNSAQASRGALAGFASVFRGPAWRRDDFAQLLGVLSELSRRVRRGGYVAIEADIEAPRESPLLTHCAALQKDEDALGLLCDALRLMSLDLGDASRAEAHMDRALEARVATRMRSVQALHTVADALPALGIVAAVLGIIKTMTAIDESNAVIGAMIASALLGTFLGVFLAYGLVGPVASRFGQIVEEDAVAMDVIRTFLMAQARGTATIVSSELARGAIPLAVQPGPEAAASAGEPLAFTRPGVHVA